MIWIVTEWYPKQNREPIVTAFDNQRAAEKYARFCSQRGPQYAYRVAIDKTNLHSGFKIYYPEE